MNAKWLREALAYIRKATNIRPRIALVLGSGLGSFADSVAVQCAIDTKDIPHYPISSVEGHAGRILIGTINEEEKTSLPLLLFQGRVHYYEFGEIENVVFSIQLAHALGTRSLLVTNAAGGINTNFEAGQLMLINDYLNFARQYPIVIKKQSSIRRNGISLDKNLQDTIRRSAQDLGINLQEGTYCWLHGPSYETAAEIKMLRILGVDAVGMSTVPEIITARSLGIKIAGISLISNMATGISSSKLSHQEVTETANKTRNSFTALLKRVILQIR